MKINIRNAKEQDISQLIKLLSQVLEVHAKIRNDIFISKTTKYQEKELLQLIQDPKRPIIVATNDNDQVLGYAFCIFETTNNPSLLPNKTLYIDDICVDENYRNQHIASKIFEYVKQFALTNNCDFITLNVWEGNDNAKRFYEKMGMKVRKTNLELPLK